jgi:hypothetical protein
MKKIFVLFGLMFAFAFSANAQSDIRKVDFRNFTYEIESLDGEAKEKVTVEDGHYSRDTEDEKYYFSVEDVVYGDLDGDGKEEAAVGIIVNTGGTGQFSSGLIYTMRGGKATLLTTFEGGDRAYGGIVGAKIVNQTLIVERNAPGEFGAACCAEFIETTRYKWNGAKLVQVGETTSVELYPAERVAFKKGTSMSIIKVKLDKYDRKRFIVGARKGQTLFVSSGIEPSNSLSYDLRRGDGDVKTTENGMIVKLKANGDYVVEISNSTDKVLDFSITIQID